MQTDPRYNDICNVFHNVKKEALPKEANILSVFSGIGSGILVLKRLKIAINHCVVVEHDPLAEAVCSSNHKKDVGSYHHISTFDMLEESIDDIMEKFGRELDFVTTLLDNYILFIPQFSFLVH